MKNNEFEKGIKFSFNNNIKYADKAVVSKHILKKETGNISLFAFDKGEEISSHASKGDAMVHILDGESEITIGEEKFDVKKGDVIVMPANVPHALLATEKFKMMLTVIFALN